MNPTIHGTKAESTGVAAVHKIANKDDGISNDRTWLSSLGARRSHYERTTSTRHGAAQRQGGEGTPWTALVGHGG